MKISNEMLLEFIIVFFFIHMLGLVTIALWVLDMKRMIK